jgi:hypothetical protein
MRTALAVFGLLVAGTAAASTIRTATWFADHTPERQQVLALCRDNPGQAKYNANCDNAFQGDVIVANREAHQRIGIALSPNSPMYWTRPENAGQRRFWAEQCQRARYASVAVRQSMHCDAIAWAGEH